MQVSITSGLCLTSNIAATDMPLANGIRKPYDKGISYKINVCFSYFLLLSLLCFCILVILIFNFVFSVRRLHIITSVSFTKIETPGWKYAEASNRNSCISEYPLIILMPLLFVSPCKYSGLSLKGTINCSKWETLSNCCFRFKS